MDWVEQAQSQALSKGKKIFKKSEEQCNIGRKIRHLGASRK